MLIRLIKTIRSLKKSGQILDMFTTQDLRDWTGEILTLINQERDMQEVCTMTKNLVQFPDLLQTGTSQETTTQT